MSSVNTSECQRQPNNNIRAITAARTQRRKQANKRPPGAQLSHQYNWTLYNKDDPLPPKWKANFVFGAAAALTVGSASVMGTETVYRLNSIYTPLFGASPGQQPYGYDQMSGLYDRYIVRAVRVDIEFTDPSTDGLHVAAMVQPASGALTLQGRSIRNCREMPGVVSGDLNNTGSQTIRFTKRFTIAEIEGVTEREMVSTSSLYSAEIDQNPTLNPWLRLAVASYNSADTTSVVRYNLRLTYETELYSRVIQAAS